MSETRERTEGEIAKAALSDAEERIVSAIARATLEAGLDGNQHHTVKQHVLRALADTKV